MQNIADNNSDKNTLKEQDKGNQVDVTILDLSKAFDTVPHNTLLINCTNKKNTRKPTYLAYQLPNKDNNENSIRRNCIRRNNCRLRSFSRNSTGPDHVFVPYIMTFRKLIARRFDCLLITACYTEKLRNILTIKYYNKS